jgi:prepilin-type N-terminal cleavage/methylation domain-containing protein
LNKGYTLIELLAALAITGMVIASLGGLLLNGQRACQRVDHRSEIQESARVGLEMMTRDIKSCQSLKEVSTDRLAVVGRDGSSLGYHVSSGTLYRSVRGVANPVANQVQSLTVREVLPDLLEVSLTTGDEEFRCQLKTRVKRMTD